MQQETPRYSKIHVIIESFKYWPNLVQIARSEVITLVDTYLLSREYIKKVVDLESYFNSFVLSQNLSMVIGLKFCFIVSHSSGSKVHSMSIKIKMINGFNKTFLTILETCVF